MKKLFEIYQLNMPVLLPRELTQWISEKSYMKITESPTPLENRFLDYELFLETIKTFATNEYADLQRTVNLWKEQIAHIEEELSKKNTTEKNILKSVRKIQDEVTSLERRIQSLEETKLESSSTYG